MTPGIQGASDYIGSLERQYSTIAKQIVQLLSNPVLRHAEIARRVGCTREYVRQIANQIGAPGSVEREKLILQAKIERLAVTVPDEGTPIWFAWKEAVKHGLPVSRRVCAWKTDCTCDERILLVNNQACVVSGAFVRANTGGSIDYGHHHITAREVNFMILAQMIDPLPWRIHVLPVEKLKRYYSGSHIYIPLRWVSPYNTIEPLIDWREHENAWDLLR